jgi:predicted alpha/beta superfamily hydrolase
MRRLATCGLLLLLPAAARAQLPPSGTIAIGKVDSVWSATLKEPRKVLIYTPPSYGDAKFLPQRYPVLYLLDGDAHFHSVTGLVQILGTGINGTFVVPEMIVVAIPNTDRMRDLTPTHVEKDPTGKVQPAFKTTGGMPNFFRFLTGELIPHIDSSYRTTPYRVLVGHSLGGIAVIDALYTTPESFSAYIAIDPSLWYDDRLLLKQAKAFFSKPGLANKTLFVGQANTINADDTTANVHYGSIVQFNGVLQSYNKSGLRYGYKYYPDDSHGSVPLIAEYDALRFIFSRFSVDIVAVMQHPAALKEHFAGLSSSFGYAMLPPESVVNLLGYGMLANDTTKALEFFQMNADLYPTSYNAWHALGDGWAATGDTKKAIAAYEKSLALNPKDEKARDAIVKLNKPGGAKSPQ